ncbi:MAG: hypothetical protein M1822_002475 [Bathelium mastoideum]|nr:MAG: hypothetical protein M1822_002475 [Bathelium mastoideum]
MSSFFGRLKGTGSPASPSTAVAPTKKDPNLPQPSPLEKLLADAGPLRADGSDKFFGFENFGSTCYANSIIQCLYYSVPFREQVINYPSRSPNELLNRTQSGLPKLNTNTSNPTDNTLSPTRSNGPQTAMSPGSSPRKPATTPANQQQPGKPEDKDSPEYKKKQLLAAGPVLSMDYENFENYGMASSLFASLKDIFEAIIAHRSRTGVVSPHKFLEILRKDNEMFRQPMHQDAHEFLNLLLNQVVENVEQFSREKAKQIEASGSSDPATGLVNTERASITNTSWVHELFEGTLTSETRCLTCENISQRDEAFLDLSVDLEQHSSVTSCLRKFSEEEMLCERNKFHCDNCGGLQEAEKRMKIKRLPRVLALHLKRFKYTEDFNRLHKLFHRVVFPYHLRLFNTTDDADDPDRLYELYAVVVHIGGGPYHGHYVSIIKTEDRGWLLFDDEMVEPVDRAYVRNFFGGESAMACAYVLFYQETTLEAMQKEQEAEGLAEATKATTTADGLGMMGQNGHASSGLHHAYTATTPTSEEPNHFASLDHAATAPVLPPVPPIRATEPEPPILETDKKADAQTKKERKAEEKERKAAEKEKEKQRRAKLKELDSQRRENYRKEEESIKAAIAASKASAAEEAKRRPDGTTVSSGDDSATATTEKVPVTTSTREIAKENEKSTTSHRENGGLMSGGLTRLRHGSISLRQKPKFWTSSKEKGEVRDVSNALDSSGEGGDGISSGTPSANQTPEKPKGPRFSLGRKKSSLLQ